MRFVSVVLSLVIALLSFAPYAYAIGFQPSPNALNLNPTGEVGSVVGNAALSPGGGVGLTPVSSALGSSIGSNLMCTPVIPTCPCGTVPNPEGSPPCVVGPNMFMCPCTDLTLGFKTAGTCTAQNVCTAGWVSSLTGMLVQQGLGVVKNLVMGQISKAITGNNSGSSIPKSTPQVPTNVCTGQRYASPVPSADPCAVYVPQNPPRTNNSSNLLGSLTGGTASTPSLFTPTLPTQQNPQQIGNSLQPISEQLLNQYISVPDIYSNPTGTQQTGDPGTGTVVLPEPKNAILTRSKSATIKVDVVDAARKTETAAFFGANSVGNENPLGLVARMCLARPWQNPFVSNRIDPSIFDTLCNESNYAVGINPVTATPKPAAPKPVEPVATTTPETPKVVLPPARAQITASPSSVTLGARTSIFWSATGVTSCIVTSPDGSFNEARTADSNGNIGQNSAATVALTGPTTFTIFCLTPDGANVASSTTVNLGI